MASSERNEINSGNDPLDMFKRGKISWNRSRDDVWKDTESSIGMTEHPVRFISRLRYFAAAAVLALAVISSFLLLYSKKYSTTGQIAEIVLPDGSGVRLSFNSTVSYHPFTWRFSRNVRLDGEAFFNVKEGGKFAVHSDQGKTEVLGTSFNMLSSDIIFEVTCFTGRVRVTSSATGSETIITANKKVTFSGSGLPVVVTLEDVEESTGWIRGEFYFTAEPLELVFAKIARSYGVKIVLQADEDLYYSGNFNKENDIEDILIIVCEPFGLKYEKEVGGYRVFELQ